MKNQEILLHAMGDVQDTYLQEAAPGQKKKTHWPAWTAAAACLVLVVGLLAWPLLQNSDSLHARYRYEAVVQSEAELVLRWEDQTLSERFTQMTMDQGKYRSRGLPIEQSLLGGKLGSCQAVGYDIYTDQTYHETFEVFAIAGIPGKEVVAVAMDANYYVFLEENAQAPATLGHLLDTYQMKETMSLLRFTDYGSKKEKHYSLESDDAIWDILEICRNAPLVDDPEFRVNGDYISFTVMSEALGVYKRVLYVTADGYLKTNALDYGYVYNIGKEAAARIMDYARTYGVETEAEPYVNFVAGTITQVAEDYILVNDGVLCWDQEDGITYKIMTDDPLFSRWMNYFDLQVGQLVYIQYRGQMEADHVITGAYSIRLAIIREHHVMIPE